MQQQSAQWMKKVAKAQADGYARGYETGFGEARTRLGMETERQRMEIETLKTTIEEIRAEAKKTKKEHGDIAILCLFAVKTYSRGVILRQSRKISTRGLSVERLPLSPRKPNTKPTPSTIKKDSASE